MSPSFWIVFWWVAFAGTHMLLSSPRMRPVLIARLGEKPFLGVYTLISFATFVPLVWVYLSNRHVDGLLWSLVGLPGMPQFAALLSVLGIALVVGAVAQPSPALAGMTKARGSRGLTRITRHPLFMGIALWSLGHLLINGFATDVLFFGGMAAFSLVGAAHQDARKRIAERERLGQFYTETSFWPFGAILAGRNRLVWSELPWISLGFGIVAAIGLYALHPWMFAR